MHAALDLARRGLAVFPCQPRGKEPACSNGLLAATTDLARITLWWESIPDLNIGIATGAVSGVFVLDVDGMEGEQSLRQLEQSNGELPPTVEAITGKGRHCYFRIGEHGAVRNSASQIAPGLDIRGDGGYVIAPPSTHPSGRAYAWSVDSEPNYADAPDWLHKLIASKNGDNRNGKPLEHWHAKLTEPIRNGERNNTLASLTVWHVNAAVTVPIAGACSRMPRRKAVSSRHSWSSPGLSICASMSASPGRTACCRTELRVFRETAHQRSPTGSPPKPTMSPKISGQPISLFRTAKQHGTRAMAGLLPCQVGRPAGVALADFPIDFGRQFRHAIVYERAGRHSRR